MNKVWYWHDGALREFLGSLALQESADSLTPVGRRGAPSASAFGLHLAAQIHCLGPIWALGRFEDAPPPIDPSIQSGTYSASSYGLRPCVHNFRMSTNGVSMDLCYAIVRLRWTRCRTLSGKRMFAEDRACSAPAPNRNPEKAKEVTLRIPESVLQRVHLRRTIA